MMTAIDQVYNEPKNLEDPNESFQYLRQCELLSLQARIERAGERNEILAKRLNRARKLAIASPMVFILFSVAWAAAEHWGMVA